MNKAENKEDSRSNAGEPVSFNILGAFQLLRSASEPLITQLKLHAQLLNIEWAEEKKRLSRMLIISLVGYACFLCLLFFIGMLVLVLTWNSDFFIISLIILCTVYGLGAFLAWRKVMKLLKCPDRLFASSRKELAADMAMILSKIS